jgi:hypothetical protein
MKKTFNRRILLRGLGGAAVAAPFLSSIMEREAKAQGMTAAPPKRLIVFFTYHGCLTDKWFPAKSHGPLSTADYQAMVTLAPMAPYASKLLMVRGIRSMNVELPGDPRAKERSAHEPRRIDVHVLPPDPQLDGELGQQRREVRCEADREIARSHRRWLRQQDLQRHAGDGREPGCRSPLPADRRRAGQPHAESVRHLVVDANGNDLRGQWLADDDLTSLTNLFGTG